MNDPKHSQLHPPALNLTRFGYDKKNRSLSAFESDLRDRPFDGTHEWLGQLWNDSADVGIEIRSEFTGKVERFYLERTETRDGDLLAWHFKPINEKLPKVDTVTIFND